MNDLYYSRPQELKKRLKRIKKMDARRKEFCLIFENWGYRMGRWRVMGKVLINVMNCKSLFPRVKDKKYFFKFALDNHNLRMIELLEANNLKIHEVKFKDGKSALHYLVDVCVSRSLMWGTECTMDLINYFLKNLQRNYCDDHGFTYLHGACMVGNVRAVNKLLRGGATMALDSYKYSPLHIAAWYRRKAIVKILLAHAANPNQRDVQQSTPLHALSWVRLCHCISPLKYCDYRKPVDEIVQILVKYGADMEARDRHGDTPLQKAVSCFDVELTKVLLKSGANILSLNEDRIFSKKFTSRELGNYPLTLNIIEMMDLLKSIDYKINFHTRFRMIKCWLRVRGNDVDYLFIEQMGKSGPCQDTHIFERIVIHLFIHREYEFYFKQDAKDYLQENYEALRQKVPDEMRNYEPSFNSLWTRCLANMKDIMITKDVSLYQLCQMTYSEGYSIFKKIKNWRIPPTEKIMHTRMSITAKRHIANILIRPHFELVVADLFMTDYCRLNLPYLACLKVAENMSDEDLLRMCEQTNENDLLRPLPKRQSERLRIQRQIH